MTQSDSSLKYETTWLSLHLLPQMLIPKQNEINCEITYNLIFKHPKLSNRTEIDINKYNIYSCSIYFYLNFL